VFACEAGGSTSLRGADDFDEMSKMIKKTNLLSGKILLGIIPLIGALLLVGCAAPQGAKPLVFPVFPPAPEEPRFIYERTIYTSADVAKEEKGADFKRMLTGEQRSGEGMAKPYGVAVYQGRVYVSDTGMHEVMAFDIPGERFFKIGEDGAGALVQPMGLDVDAKGDLYVLDAKAKHVMVYDKDGHFKRNLGNEKLFSRPTGIAVDAEGEKIYVVDTGAVTDEQHQVLVFDARDGKHLFNIGKRGTNTGEFNLPRDATISKDGSVYVVDGGNFRVQRFKPDGTFVGAFGAVGRRSGQFSRPKEVATDADGNVYVVDSAFGNFQIFNAEGQILLAVGSRSETDGMAKFMLPSGIAVDGDGRVYVVDQYFRKVEVFRPAALAADAGFVAKKAPEPKK
jgi:DNA-binding beta-propeller fold protein YncE